MESKTCRTPSFNLQQQCDRSRIVSCSRFVHANEKLDRPRGDGHDEDTVHEFLGRPHDRHNLSRHDHGRHQPPPGR